MLLLIAVYWAAVDTYSFVRDARACVLRILDGMNIESAAYGAETQRR